MAGPEGERPRVERTAQKPTQPEQTQLQQGRAAGNSPVENVRLPKMRKAVFDCALPKSKEPPSLFTIKRNLRDGIWNREEVSALEQQWLDYLKTMDRQALEETLIKSEVKWEDWKHKQKRKRLTAHGEALLPVLEEDVAVIREELRRRE
jgi:hypothetical protein